MRIVREVNHQDCKITIFNWNNRYLIKLEQGFLEQTFKVNEYDVANEDSVAGLLDATFMAEAVSRFIDMANSLQAALQRA